MAEALRPPDWLPDLQPQFELLMSRSYFSELGPKCMRFSFMMSSFRLSISVGRESSPPVSPKPALERLHIQRVQIGKLRLVPARYAHSTTLSQPFKRSVNLQTF